MRKKTSTNTIVLIISIILFSVVAFLFMSTRFGSNYQKSLASENTDDICKAPAGYTEEAWRQHMSHHPDRYKQCFQK